jgi:hypothetical protein
MPQSPVLLGLCRWSGVRAPSHRSGLGNAVVLLVLDSLPGLSLALSHVLKLHVLPQAPMHASCCTASVFVLVAKEIGSSRSATVVCMHCTSSQDT